MFSEFFLEDLAQTTIDGLMFGSVYALVAIGFTLIWGVLRILNLAHGQTVAFSMFAGMLLTVHLNVPLVLAFFIAMLTGLLVGVIIERLCYWPIRRAHELVPMIAMLGFWIATEEALQKVYFEMYFHDYVRFPNPYTFIQFAVGPLTLRFDYLLTLGVTLLLLATLYLILFRTRLGMALRMVAADHEIAHLMGVNVSRTLTSAFAIAGAYGGAAGVLLGMVTNMANPYSGTLATVKGLFTMILGGAGSLPGAVVGGITLGFIELQGAFLISFAYKDAIAMGLLFLLLALRPQGLFGSREQEKI